MQTAAEADVAVTTAKNMAEGEKPAGVPNAIIAEVLAGETHAVPPAGVQGIDAAEGGSSGGSGPLRGVEDGLRALQRIADLTKQLASLQVRVCLPACLPTYLSCLLAVSAKWISR
jgi:hypothetical protein